MVRDYFGNFWERKIDQPESSWGFREEQEERENKTEESATQYENDKEKQVAYKAKLVKELIFKYAESNGISLEPAVFTGRVGAEGRGTPAVTREFLRPLFNALWEDDDVQSLLTVLAKPIPKGDLGTEEDYQNKLEEIVFKKCSEVIKD